MKIFYLLCGKSRRHHFLHKYTLVKYNKRRVLIAHWIQTAESSSCAQTHFCIRESWKKAIKCPSYLSFRSLIGLRESHSKWICANKTGKKKKWNGGRSTANWKFLNAHRRIQSVNRSPIDIADCVTVSSLCNGFYFVNESISCGINRRWRPVRPARPPSTVPRSPHTIQSMIAGRINRSNRPPVDAFARNQFRVEREWWVCNVHICDDFTGARVASPPHRNDVTRENCDREPFAVLSVCWCVFDGVRRWPLLFLFRIQ